ncbi:GNAT family N-acetyltransferase [Oceanomicrobium pacificus]|uniref:GNAT family N-acetyltransferase n=1 Tax=Oceanomicrobium pacificus TaxID=2692916 RepID=A0A6B0TJV8_9RHOB|nr:GNAT family N-acetyltransferase [Oceanomicrobium pacificus]MXU64146.1 GNAT family N-acetyltransferase [Oceanomicrobium pacificus]
MSYSVAPADPTSDEARDLLAESQALMRSLFPPEANHYLEAEALAGPGMRFWILRDAAGTATGCVALADKGDYGEIKSMFVAEDARGSGAADALMAELLAAARAAGLPRLRLETGDRLTRAHGFYRRHGFAPCGPFGAYEAGPHSLFFERAVGADGGN